MICIVHISQMYNTVLFVLYMNPAETRILLVRFYITIWLLYSTQYSTCIVHDIVYNAAYYIALYNSNIVISRSSSYKARIVLYSVLYSKGLNCRWPEAAHSTAIQTLTI